jgi:hypothetical protein
MPALSLLMTFDRLPGRGRINIMDANGRGHVPGTSPVLKLENAVIALDRVSLRMVVDTKKHSVAWLG